MALGILISLGIAKVVAIVAMAKVVTRKKYDQTAAKGKKKLAKK